VEKAEKLLAKASKPLVKAQKGMKRFTIRTKKLTKAAEKVTAQRLLVVDKLLEVAAEATEELRLFFHTPPATFRALKAALFMLGKPTDQFDSWAKARTFVSPALFEELSAFDATADRVMADWKGVRACMKGLASPALQVTTPNPTRSA